MNPVITLKNIEKLFKTDEIATQALNGINLVVNPGEFVAITGPSGCGKSTLLSVLGLIDEPTDGEYSISGKQAVNLSSDQRAHIRANHIGFIFQAFNLIRALIPEDKNDIFIDSLSRNTNENAIETKKVLERSISNGKYILFTSAIHMRRASACFAKQNIDCDEYSTNNTFKESKYTLDYYLIPSSLAFYHWDAIFHEITGMIVYKYMGYI